MYKILIKYTSTSKKTFWQNYEVYNEDGTSVEFSTDDLEVLKKEIKKLDCKYGHENIRIIYDITYNVLVEFSEAVDLGNAVIATPTDVNDVFEAAFANVFGGG